MGFSSGCRVALVVSAVLLGGCPASDDVGLGETDSGGTDAGGTDAGGTDAGEPADGDEVARLAAAICERQAACGCEQDGDPLNLADCQASHYEGLLQVSEYAAEAENYGLDEPCMRELADCWEQLACGESAEALCVPECAVHQLNRASGDGCEPDALRRPRGFVSQCEPGLACLSGHGYSLCSTPEPLGVGESCSGGGHRRCASELFCATPVGGESSECLPLAEEGSTCESASECVSGLRCDEGLCGPRVGLGEDCEFITDCSDGLSCHPVDEVCVEPSEIGEQCRFLDTMFVPCVEDAWCGEQDCEAPLQLGEACMFSNGCPEGSQCEGGVCAAYFYDSICGEVPSSFDYVLPWE